MPDWDDPRWNDSEEYEGQRFGNDGWGPTPDNIKAYYEEEDEQTKKEIGRKLGQRYE